MLVDTFIGTLMRTKLLGFKLSRDQKGLIKWYNCYGFLAWERLRAVGSVWDPLLLIFGVMFRGVTMQKQAWSY